jgi:DNA-binding protein HU-beta
MKKSEFIDAVAEKAQMSKAAAARAVEAIFDTASGAVSEAVQKAGHLSIPGFGKFTRRTRAARKGRNPRTGQEIDIPERNTVSFTPGKGFRDSLGAVATSAPAAETSAGAKRGGAAKGGGGAKSAGASKGGSSARSAR